MPVSRCKGAHGRVRKRVPTQGPQAPSECPGRDGPSALCAGSPSGRPHPTALGSRLCPQASPLQAGGPGPAGAPCPPQCQPGGHPQLSASPWGEAGRVPGVTAGKGAWALAYGQSTVSRCPHPFRSEKRVHPGDAGAAGLGASPPSRETARRTSAVTSHVLGDQRSHLLRRWRGCRVAPSAGGGPQRPA